MKPVMPAPSEVHWRNWLDRLPLSVVSVDRLIGASQRAVIIAPHPDDEVLMAGGLLQALAESRIPVALVAVTDGDASHPRSRRFGPRKLCRIRAAETQHALTTLGVGEIVPVRLHLSDRRISVQEPRLRRILRDFLQRGDIAITTWRHDGHADHDACGRATASVSGELGIACLEVPVWSWQWRVPGDRRIPWAKATALALSSAQRSVKVAALSRFKSQTSRDRTSGDAPVLNARMLRHFDRPFEVFFQ